MRVQYPKQFFCLMENQTNKNLEKIYDLAIDQYEHIQEEMDYLASQVHKGFFIDRLSKGKCHDEKWERRAYVEFIGYYDELEIFEERQLKLIEMIEEELPNGTNPCQLEVLS